MFSSRNEIPSPILTEDILLWKVAEQLHTIKDIRKVARYLHLSEDEIEADTGRKLPYSSPSFTGFDRDTMNKKAFELLRNWRDRAYHGDASQFLKLCDAVQFNGYIDIDGLLSETWSDQEFPMTPTLSALTTSPTNRRRRSQSGLLTPATSQKNERRRSQSYFLPPTTSQTNWGRYSQSDFETDDIVILLPDGSVDLAHLRPLLSKASKEGERPVYRGRIMLVGHSGAGKTHLLKNLLKQQYIAEKDRITNGIEIECRVSVDRANSDFIIDNVPSVSELHKSETILEASSRMQKSSTLEKTFTKTDPNLESWQKDDIQSTMEKNIKPNILSFWDFGGQVVFYTTHQTFLTQNGIYLLVFDFSLGLGEKIPTTRQSSDRDDDPLYSMSVPQTSGEFILYWFNSIHAYATDDGDNGPPIILIGTHTDKVDPKIINSRIKEIRKLLRGKAVVIHEEIIMTISNTECTGNDIQNIRDKIIKVLEKQTHYWGKPRPIRWMNMESTLQEKGKKHLRHKDVVQMTKWPIEEVEEFLMYQHELGEFVYFGHLSCSSEGSLVITDPQWLIDKFRSIITIPQYQDQDREIKIEWSCLEEEGILKNKLITHVWGKHNDLVDNKQCNWEKDEDWIYKKECLLQIMEKFDLISPIESTASTSGEARYIVPCMLQPLREAELHEKQAKEGNLSPLYYAAKNHFLPDGFYYRLLARFCSHGKDMFQVYIKEKRHQLFSNYAEFINKTDTGDITSSTILINDPKSASISIQIDKKTTAHLKSGVSWKTALGPLRKTFSQM